MRIRLLVPLVVALVAVGTSSASANRARVVVEPHTVAATARVTVAVTGLRRRGSYEVSASVQTDDVNCQGTTSGAIPNRARRAQVVLSPRPVWCSGTYVVSLRRFGRTVGTSDSFVVAPVVSTPTPPAPTPAPALGNVVGHVTIGPWCPVERVGIACRAPIEPAITTVRPCPAFDATDVSCGWPLQRVTVVIASTAGEVARTETSPAGDFATTLPPGAYTASVAERIGIKPTQPVAFIVTPATTTSNPVRVDITIDTGIRLPQLP